jgi:hypothetical protein
MPRNRQIGEFTYTELVWTAVDPNTPNVAPDTDTIIEARRGETIEVQFIGTTTINESNNIDLNIESSPNGGTMWGLYNSNNFGTLAKHILVTPGPVQLRGRLDNNHATGTANCQANVNIRFF